MASPDSSLSLSPVPSPQSQPSNDNITLFTKSSPSLKLAPQNAKNTISSTTSSAPPTEKIKKPRKKRESAPDDGKPKEKKPRKPRVSNPDGAAARKKQKIFDASAIPAPRQPTLSDMMNPKPASSPLASMMAPSLKLGPAAKPPTQPPRPISSGQRYDPIRGLIDEPVPSKPVTSSSPQIMQNSSPSSLAHLMHPNPPATTSHPAIPQSMTPTITPKQNPPPVKPVSDVTAMEIDPPNEQPASKQPTKTIDDKTVTKQVVVAPVAKIKKSPPPRSTGSGLLSGSDLLGGIGSSDDGKGRRGVDINIEIKLSRTGVNTINIAQEILKKYGRDAINPRAAAHRERLLQVAAAANRLESGDEMSVDGDSDKGDDSTADMVIDGQSTAGEGADGDKPRKRRRRKAEDYDKEDDFIDDTEMAWEESAAVAKDGFFVYSGPLVKPQEKAEAEKTTTTTRGRGRGRGSRGGRGGAGVTHASVAAKSETAGATTNGTTGRGRGRGRGGTGATRKPRMPKDDSAAKATISTGDAAPKASQASAAV